MSKATKYPAWFDYYRQPYFYGVRPVPVNEILTEIKSETQDGRYDHVVFENDEIRVLADITGSEDYGLELEVRTYKKEVSSNEKKAKQKPIAGWLNGKYFVLKRTLKSKLTKIKASILD